MENLNTIDLYNKASEKTVNSFSNRLNSSLKVTTDFDKVEANFEWLELIEETIPYIDNILRAPNRFIVNEEDVIKIELAKRVTVESIKHLSRNTNLIQDYNQETGDVKPSKILNITKEETYDTYENKLIYTLIQNIKTYLEIKKQDMVYESSEKNDKKFEYTGSSNVGQEKINVNMIINTKFNSKNKELNDEGIGIEERLKKLESNLAVLTNSEVYKSIEKKHIALIVPPVKKTNLIIKNVNFQYAMKLWDFLHSNIESTVKRKKDKQNYEDKGNYKDLVDETFLLNYLIINSVDKKEQNVKSSEEAKEQIVNNMIGQIMQLDDNITEEKLQDIVSKQFTVVKYKSVVNDTKIKQIFRDNINKYMDKLVEL